MKERPILFSGEMVRAILDGRKTQTRRVIKPQPPEGFKPGFSFFTDPGEYEIRDNTGRFAIGKVPYGKKGDRLWVRETWGIFQEDWTDDGWESEGMINPKIPKSEKDLSNNNNL